MHYCTRRLGCLHISSRPSYKSRILSILPFCYARISPSRPLYTPNPLSGGGPSRFLSGSSIKRDGGSRESSSFPLISAEDDAGDLASLVDLIGTSDILPQIRGS